MPLVNGDLRDALREAGASIEATQAASASLAAVEVRIVALMAELKILRGVVIVALGLIVLLFLKVM